MKKIIALTLTFILVFSLVSCKLAEKEEASPEQTTIPTEEPTPEPTLLYICDLHGLYNDEVIYATWPNKKEIPPITKYLFFPVKINNTSPIQPKNSPK